MSLQCKCFLSAPGVDPQLYCLLIPSSAHQLRERGWVVPAYTMAPHSEKMKLMRIVVREDFTKSRCDALIADIKLALQTLDAMDTKKIQEQKE